MPLSLGRQATITSVGSVLSGADGIGTYPEPATAADAVSMAEVLSWISARNSVPGGINPFGSVYYVAASGGSNSATGGGLDPNEPMATIAATITAGAAGDTIVLGPGTHSVDVSAAALVPKADMRFVSAIAPNGGKPSTIITADADDGADVILIDVDGVVFEGIEFLQVATGGTAVRLIAVSQTSAIGGLTIKDCWINLNNVDASSLVAIAINDATNATTGVSITGCRFLGGLSTSQPNYIQIGVGGLLASVIEHNTFELKAAAGDCYGVHFLDNAAAANKSYGTVIRYNSAIGPLDAGDDGILVFINSSLTRDEIIALVHSNYCGRCAAPITIDKINEGVINNYIGDTGTGGTLVDAGT